MLKERTEARKEEAISSRSALVTLPLFLIKVRQRVMKVQETKVLLQMGMTWDPVGKALVAVKKQVN